MKIIIVGGGTAGWMTAAYLAKYRGGQNITVIESDKIPIIGVGESVTPHLAHFFNEIGIKEHDWMLKTAAVYKYANRFLNWKDNKGEYEYFSFNYTVPENNFLKDITVNRSHLDFSDDTSGNRSIDYLAYHCKNNTFKRFDQYFNPQFHYMEKNVAPFYNNEHLLNQPFSHSQHINAELAAKYIKEQIALPSGVTHIVDKVVDVKSKGDVVSEIKLESGKIITGDLFVDCSGFHKALISKLGWKDIPYHNHVIDSAFVCQTDYVNPKEEMVNYSQTIAEPYGWRFKLGLYHRMGNGYVYSSKHVSDYIIEDYLKKLLNKDKVKQIKWKPSKLEKFGSGNVAAVGLSCGFIEPLEANALYEVVTSIKRLNKVLDKPTLDFSTYNKKMNYTIDDIADFILVHYTMSNRQDTFFWKDMKELGVKLKHKDLIIEKINHINNSMKSSVTGYTTYPDYMWMQLAVSWGLDIPKRNLNKDIIELSKLHFEHFERKHNIISNLVENNYEWHKKNIFKIEPDEWKRQYVDRL